MQNPNAKIKNVAGACNTYDIKKINLSSDNNTNQGAGRKPSRLRVALDFVLSPLWVSLPRSRGRIVFHVLGIVLGKTRLYTLLGASYLNFLNRKAVA